MISGRFRGVIHNKTTRADARTLFTHMGSTNVTTTQ